MSQLKTQIQNVDAYFQIQLLTLAPQSWSVKKVSAFFEVNEYKVKSAKNIFNTKGLLGIPDPKKGKRLSMDTMDMVLSFYENGVHSRLMPGKKDYVSIGKGIHVQKDYC